MAEHRYLPRKQALATSTQHDRHKLTQVVLERVPSFTSRTSWKTVNQVTIKETTKMIREIKNVARKKLPSTKSMGDRIERA